MRPLKLTLMAMMMAICTSRLGTSWVERPMIMPTYLRGVGLQAWVRGVTGLMRGAAGLGAREVAGMGCSWRRT